VRRTFAEWFEAYEKVLCWVLWSPICTPWAPRTSMVYLAGPGALVVHQAHQCLGQFDDPWVVRGVGLLDLLGQGFLVGVGVFLVLVQDGGRHLSFGEPYTQANRS
jgi:hypothetical protein